MENTIPVSEIFISPQGEGLTTGLMTCFVRVAGCNLAIAKSPCLWCDTKYAWYPRQAKVSVTSEELKVDIDKIMLDNGLKEICLTGGEPLLYSEQLKGLIDYWSKRYHLTIETNGSLSIWKYKAMWSLDTKCPSSGNAIHNLYSNLDILTEKDQVKFIIGTRDDFNFARDLVKMRIFITNIIFQPAWKMVVSSELIDWVKKDDDIRGRVRIGIQAHKYWYPKRKKGV